MQHCLGRRELAIYKIVFFAPRARDIFISIKGAGKHLRLMQIRSRCFRLAYSGLRSRAPSPHSVVSRLPSISVVLPWSSVLLFLPHYHRLPSTCEDFSRAGSLPRRIETLPDGTAHLPRGHDTMQVLFCIPGECKNNDVCVLQKCKHFAKHTSANLFNKKKKKKEKKICNRREMNCRKYRVYNRMKKKLKTEIFCNTIIMLGAIAINNT